MTYTLERPDIDCIERFLVAKEGRLFAAAVSLEQGFIGTKKLVVNDCPKPSFCGVELFCYAALIVDNRLMSGDGLRMTRLSSRRLRWIVGLNSVIWPKAL